MFDCCVRYSDNLSMRNAHFNNFDPVNNTHLKLYNANTDKHTIHILGKSDTFVNLYCDYSG